MGRGFEPHPPHHLHMRESLNVEKIVVLTPLRRPISIREGYADHAVDGVVAAYGGPVEWGNFPSAFERIEDFRAPVLGLFAEADTRQPRRGDPRLRSCDERGRKAK